MNQTYPRLIALGSRKRAKRAALSRTGPIFVESSEAGRSIVIESLAARIHRAYSALLLPSTIPPPPPLPPLPTPWQANNDDPSPLEADLGGTVSKRDSVFSPTAAGALRFCIFPRTVLYEVGGGGKGEGWSARQIHPANGLCGCKAAIRHNTRKGPFSVSTSEVVVPFLNSFIASTVAVNQTPLSFYCPRSRLEPARSIVTTRGRTRSLSSARESPIEISLVSPPFVHLCSPSPPPLSPSFRKFGIEFSRSDPLIVRRGGEGSDSLGEFR